MNKGLTGLERHEAEYNTIFIFGKTIPLNTQIHSISGQTSPYVILGPLQTSNKLSSANNYEQTLGPAAFVLESPLCKYPREQSINQFKYKTPSLS